MSSESRHQLIAKLGSGGFGTVYRALDTQLDREVAIKRLNVAPGSSRAELNRQLLREAKVLATLKHPNIVTIYDIRSEADSGEIIMELIEGVTIDKLVDQHPVLPEDFVYIATQLLSALATAHENNILHCDLKPTNVMLRTVGKDSFEMKILDFGMSPALLEAGSQSSTSSKMMGSIHFMAPEQFDNTPVSPATDIYSIGCLFYYALTGFKPFAGETTVQVMASHVTGSYQPLLTLIPSLNPDLAAWIEKHICKNPAERHTSIRASLNQLLALSIYNSYQGIEITSPDYPSKTNQPSPLRRQALSPLEKATEAQSAIPQVADREKSILAGIDSDLAAKLEKNFEQSKPKTAAQPKPPKSIADQVIKVEKNAIWYFTVNGSQKGPIPLDKLSDLVSEGHVGTDESVWHPSFREWQKVNETDDLADSVALFNSQSKLTARVQIPQAPKESLKNTKPQKFQEPKEIIEAPSCKLETLVIILGTIAVSALIWKLPKVWQLSFIIFGIFLVVISLIRTRMTMAKRSVPLVALSLVTPFLSDVIYSILRPRLAFKNLPPLVLGVALLAYSLWHRYPNDAFHLLELDEPLQRIYQTLGSL